MYLIKNSQINKIYYLVFLFFYSTLVFGFFLNEDSIGGAKHDYYYHLKFINLSIVFQLFRNNDNFYNIL